MDNKELEKQIFERNSQSYALPPKFWESNKELDILSEHLKQLQAQQYTQTTTYATHELREVNERLRLIESSLETLMNMLKLILTTQIEKEMREKEKI